MPQQITCDSCGGPIEERGWKAQPALVVDGMLVGVMRINDGLQSELVGQPYDLCTDCVPLDHPRESDAD